MYIVRDQEATKAVAAQFAKDLPPSSILALHGELGAGKTTFVQGLVRGLGGVEDEVQSPTFPYLNIYPTPTPLFHFDLYRLRDAKDFYAMGFEEYFGEQGIVAIEWPERIDSILPQNCIHLFLSYREGNQREIKFL